ncbi:MAG: ATP-binding cassette domain-containing protein, partial [Clostridia bacterium]|nr:ATP-binding cassette domain-containing protein [Clostridia bacterium]
MIKLENVSLTVNEGKEKKDILKNINLTLDDKLIAFTGPNGGGKSTLAKIIMGIIKPTSGKIYFNGEDITDLSIDQRANKGIAFAFQQPVKFKGITVSDLVNLASGKKLKVNDVCAYLSEVGLCAREYVNREINSSLSGGELKRIELAVTMARNSNFTIFDEPEAGIDLWSFKSLITVFERLVKKSNGTLLIISHQERILNIADRIII